MKPRIHNCAAVGCQAQVSKPLLMCVDHWRRVPAVVRRQVCAAYRGLRSGPSAHEAYRRAVNDAVNALHSKQQAKKTDRDKATPDMFG